MTTTPPPSPTLTPDTAPPLPANLAALLAPFPNVTVHKIKEDTFFLLPPCARFSKVCCVAAATLTLLCDVGDKETQALLR